MVRVVIALVLVVLAHHSAYAFPKTPNPEVTPGDLCDTQDPDFAELRYEEKVAYCLRNVSNERKSKIYSWYLIDKKERRNYTVDHLIPLALGGNNSDENLWPEHRKLKETRLNLEYELYQKLERGEISQAQAIQTILDAKMHPPIDAALKSSVEALLVE